MGMAGQYLACVDHVTTVDLADLRQTGSDFCHADTGGQTA